jgi:hypothetical protein
MSGYATNQELGRPNISKVVGEDLSVMSIPITLKTVIWIVLFLKAEKLCELRIAILDLATGGVAMIRQIVRTTPARGHIDQSPESPCGALNPFRTMHDM